MWEHELVRETDVTPEAIWSVLSDLDGWPRWDTSMEQVHLRGPFAEGTQVSMTPKGQDPIVSTIVAITEPEYYADRTEFGGVTLQFSHRLTRLANGGTRITHRLEITGDAAAELGPRLGPEITSDFPEAMDGLVACAAAQSTV
jgi:uncharacterized protein YndB with AHSA1/START domain